MSLYCCFLDSQVVHIKQASTFDGQLSPVCPWCGQAGCQVWCKDMACGQSADMSTSSYSYFLDSQVVHMKQASTFDVQLSPGCPWCGQVGYQVQCSTFTGRRPVCDPFLDCESLVLVSGQPKWSATILITIPRLYHPVPPSVHLQHCRSSPSHFPNHNFCHSNTKQKPDRHTHLFLLKTLC